MRTDCVRDHGPRQRYIRWVDECACGTVVHFGCHACDEERDGEVIYDQIEDPDAVAGEMLLWSGLFGKE